MAPNDPRSMQRGKPVVVVGAIAVALIGAAYFAGSGSGAASSPPLTSVSVSSTTSSTTISPTAIPPTTISPTTTPSTTPPAPVDLGTYRSSAPSAAACGSELPVEVAVASVAAVKGAAPSTPPVGRQIVRHWTTPERTVEVRWPPDPRELSTGGKYDVAANTQVGSWGMATQSVLTVRGGNDNGADGPVLFVVTQKRGIHLGVLTPRCSVVQFRVIAANGTYQTVGVPLPLPLMTGQLVDLGPLVEVRSTSLAVVPLDRAIACPANVTEVAAVHAALPNATPAGALRDFTESDAWRQVPQPELMRPFTQTRLTSDNTYRYEHFLAWSEYVAITVERSGTGWAVTHWEHGQC
jgi:hypothetical protein